MPQTAATRIAGFYALILMMVNPDPANDAPVMPPIIMIVVIGIIVGP
jgi:hypothetical protein